MSWINFRELRSSLSFEQILDHYRVDLKISNGKATGFCPLPSHRGQGRSPSFSVQFAKGIFQCFGCGAKGNVLDFACLMEGKNPRHGPDIHAVARDLQDRFLGHPQSKPQRNARLPSRRSVEKEQPTHEDRGQPGVARVATSGPAVINAPLDFELRELDADHPYLGGRGFTSKTIEQFGLGFCNRGTLKGRVVIPLHDAAGQLVGYAGRIADDKLISRDCPKYKFPAPREREGNIHELHKSLFLYNGHRIKVPVDDLVVVEGFPSVWWLAQHGFDAVVALMGWSCSPEQAALIIDLVQPEGKTWILTDGDDGGERCGQNILPQVAPHRFVRWIRLGDGEQPTDCTGEELAAILPICQSQMESSKKTRRTKRKDTVDAKS